jgi:hypothetical protein
MISLQLGHMAIQFQLSEKMPHDLYDEERSQNSQNRRQK